MQRLAQAIGRRRDNGAASRTADGLEAAMIPASGCCHALLAIVMERRDVPGIQPAHGWEEGEGRGSPPFVVMKPRKVSGIQPAHGWSGSQGQEGPSSRCRERNPCRTQTKFA